jgi:hypothetical protein
VGLAISRVFLCQKLDVNQGIKIANTIPKTICPAATVLFSSNQIITSIKDKIG